VALAGRVEWVKRRLRLGGRAVSRVGSRWSGWRGGHPAGAHRLAGREAFGWEWGAVEGWRAGGGVKEALHEMGARWGVPRALREWDGGVAGLCQRPREMEGIY
jgi:hypothetical protein